VFDRVAGVVFVEKDGGATDEDVASVVYERDGDLIAAAPDLLAALKRIIKEATGHTLASLDEATAAIAKAERSP
jgi:hypothetical protein